MNSGSAEAAIRYRYLYNSLALFAMEFDKLLKLDSPIFDIEFELGSEFEIGFDLKNINYLLEAEVIPRKVENELLEFKSFIIAVPNLFWTIEELETNPIWNEVRARANVILDILGTSDRDYDFSIETIVSI